MRRLAWIAVLLVALSSPAGAATLTFQVDATITTSSIAFPGDVGYEPQVGGSLRWTYSFESYAIDTDPSDPTHGDYLGNPTSNIVDFGPYALDLGTGPYYFIAVWTDDQLNSGHFGSSSYRLGTQFVEPATVLPDGSVIFAYAVLELFDSSGTAIADDSLPLVPPDLDRFDTRTILLATDLGYLEAEIDTIRAVDEPAPVLSLLVAAIATAATRRRWSAAVTPRDLMI